MRVFIAALVVSAATVGALATSAVPSRLACTPKVVTVKGHPGVVECGPATATVKFKGKTIRYAGGSCKKSGPLLSLYIGTHVTGGGSNHLFYLLLEKPAGSYTPKTGLIGIQLAYASYHWDTGTLKVKAGGKSGTFRGTLVKFPQTKSSGAFSGSYSC
jgi:hypothetical protein